MGQADRRAKIHTKKRRISRKEVVNVDTVDSTNSETDIHMEEVLHMHQNYLLIPIMPQQYP